MMRAVIARARPVATLAAARSLPLFTAAAAAPARSRRAPFARFQSTATLSAQEQVVSKVATVPEVQAKKKNIASGAEADTGASEIIKPTDAALRAQGTITVQIDGEASPAISQPSITRTDKDWTLMHPIWHGEYVNQVSYTHLPPQETVDKLAFWTIKAIRFNFDWMSGYSFGKLTESKALTRIVFLETVAGVPGSIAATLRHLASLRRMKRDGGFINTLMAEAENERMHLLTFLELRKPGWFMRACVFATQGIFFNFFWVAYLISPKFCHRLVGYLEEEAVVTYTKIVHAIQHGELKEWQGRPAPAIAIKYWNLPANATVEDVCRHVRADEAHHRDVNHTLAGLKEGELNPFRDGHA